MKTFVQCVVFVAAGLLIRQLCLVACAQEIALSPAVAPFSPRPPSSPLTGARSTRGSGTTVAGIPAKEAASNPGQADGKGDPALGGERHPLYRLTKSDTFELHFTFSPEFNQNLTVQPDGFVVLRGAGTRLAEGLTVPELQQGITKAYSSFLHD